MPLGCLRVDSFCKYLITHAIFQTFYEYEIFNNLKCNANLDEQWQRDVLNPKCTT